MQGRKNVEYLLIYYAVINVIAVFLYASDKGSARRRQTRIPEATLLGVGLLGGAIGALLGMKLFRHKTKHRRFWIENLLFVLLHAAIVWYFFL